MTPKGQAGAPRLALCLVVGSEGYGVRRVWSDVFAALQAHGWEVLVVILDGARLDEWRKSHPSLRIVSPPGGRQLPGVSPGRWRKLLSMTQRAGAQLGKAGWIARTTRQSGASALILQSPPESLLAGIVTRLTGLRTLWLVPNVVGSGVPFNLNRWVYRMVFRLGRVVPVSNSHYTDSTFGPGGFERHVVHLGVDTSRYCPGGDPASVRAAFAIPMDATVIGLFARVTPSKGQDRLMEAIAESRTPFHVLLCGGPTDGPFHARLVALVERLELTGRVHFAGVQSDLRPYYAACDLVASVSTDAEGFGLTVAEAMACGIPVLAHRLGGPGEIVLDGETGWLLPDVEVRTIVAGLDRAMAARDQWALMGEKGRDRAVTHFGHRRFASKIVDLADPDKIA